MVLENWINFNSSIIFFNKARILLKTNIQYIGESLLTNTNIGGNHIIHFNLKFSGYKISFTRLIEKLQGIMFFFAIYWFTEWDKLIFIFKYIPYLSNQKSLGWVKVSNLGKNVGQVICKICNNLLIYYKI